MSDGDRLPDIVRGPWGGTPYPGDTEKCYVSFLSPKWISMTYWVGPQTSDDVDMPQAVVKVGGLSFKVRYNARGDDRPGALRRLLEMYGSEVRRYAGTVHPADLEGAYDGTGEPQFMAEMDDE